VYSRRLDGHTLTFDHARFLHEGSFVMYDLETVSLWIHTTGEAAVGEHKWKVLEFIPSIVTTWKNWRSEHPQTRVLNVKEGNDPRFRLREKPQDGGLSVGEPDGYLKFYPFSVLSRRRVINDEAAGRAVVVVFDPDEWAYAAFERGDRTFAWQDGKMVDHTGREWSLLKGTSDGETLKPVSAVVWLTRYWKRFYPEGEMYADDGGH
jgi:hypothetical protein